MNSRAARIAALLMPIWIQSTAADWTPPSEELDVRTLGGEMRVFPRDAPIPRAIFVVTYSKAATTAASDWTRELRGMKPTWDVKVYQVAVLDDVPALFRGPVISAMAAGVPQEMHDRFWIGELRGRQWRLFTESEADEVPHVVVLDHRNRVAWRAHGAATKERVRELAALPPP